MRTPFVSGNWKMNKTASEAAAFASGMVNALRDIKGVEIVLCPPFISIAHLSNILKGSDIGLGAQNMHWETKGAFTGEIAPGMVAEFCRYVIIGHSERRKWFGENDDMVNKKVKAALEIGLIPILCVGETEEEYSSKQTGAVIVK
jgi:triosephosphate isomerase (TIM)